MRRSIAVIVTTVVAVALALSTSNAANADSVPFPPISPTHYMIGNLDSIALVPGVGVEATGWALNTQHPQDGARNVAEMQIQYPDGSAYQTGLAYANLPRPDVAAAYPGAGEGHGFLFNFGYLAAGNYKMCAEVSFEVVGCGFITVPQEVVAGAIESLTIDNSPTDAGLRIHGWETDNWGQSPYGSGYGSRIDYAVTRTELDGTVTDFGDGTYATEKRPDIEASHPGKTAGGFDSRIGISGPGTYTVCASVGSVATSRDAGTIGCSSIFVRQIGGTPGTMTGDATLGSTLAVTPGTWSPTPAQESIRWTRWRFDNDTTPISAFDNKNQYTVTAADVGHRIAAVDFVSTPGGIGRTTTLESDVITIPGVTTSRIGGADRYEAAVTNSAAQFPDSAAGAPVVYVASGANFPDALTAGPAAVKQGGALLLTPPDVLLENVRAEILRLHPAKIVVVGGPVSVSPAVLTELSTIAPAQRIDGADRFAVSRALIAYAFPDGAPSLYLTTGNSYPDALSAAAAAGSLGEPVLLVDGHAASVDAATKAELHSLHATSVTIAGGPASVTPGIAGSLGSGIAVTRATGADRYAASIATNRGAFSTADTVYLTTGLNFPDGLVGGVHAGSEHAPLYLVDGTCVPQEVITDIAALHATKVVVLGGTTSMQSQLDDLSACG